MMFLCGQMSTLSVKNNKKAELLLSSESKLIMMTMSAECAANIS